MTESIPELRAARDGALAAVDVYRVPGASGWHSRHRVWERAEQMLQSALWRQAVASHRWVREYDQFVIDYGEPLTWKFMADCQAVYWVVSRGRTEPAPGWGDGAQIAVYAPGAGAPGDRCACGEVTAEDEFEVDW